MRKAGKPIALVTIILFLTGLGLFAYLGVYNRYWADDWCYNADLKELGFLGALKGYTYITTYASNRYSLTFFSGLLYFLGISGVQIMTPLNILLLVAALYWTLANIRKILDSGLPSTSLVIISAIAVYYSIYLAPHLYQSLYWRSGSLPYFDPLVFGVLIFALITYQGTLTKPSRWSLPVLAVLAFFAGGFSEAGCATLIVALSVYILVAWVFRTRPWAKSSLPAAVIAICFALMAMVVLILSPTNTHRLGLYGRPSDFVRLPLLVLGFSFDFVRFSFSDLPFPHLAIAGLSLLLGYLLYVPENQPLRLKAVILVVLMIAAIAFILVASSYAPSAYIEKSPPAPRTRIIPRFILTFALVITAWLIGCILRQTFQSRWLDLVAGLGFMFVAAYSLYTVVNVGRQLSVYSQRAGLWDERDAQIRAAIQGGSTDIKVNAIDGMPVGGIRDFEVRGQGKPGYWINQCAARYYGVEAIDVVPP